MKKLIVGLFVAMLMGTGLVAFTSSSATAACPYTGCVDTTTHLRGPGHIEPRHRATFRVKVTTDGNATPKGTVRLTIRKPGSSFSREHSLVGGKTTFRSKRLARGHYRVTAKYIPKPGSVFKRSSDSMGLRVS